MKNKITILVSTFVGGAIIGAAIFWMICNCCCKTNVCSTSSCCKPPSCEVKTDSTGLTRIKPNDAKTYLLSYRQNPITVTGFKGFTISYPQFNAMKIIAARDTSVHGFRIYMGQNGKSQVRVVVGTGSPDKVDNIFVTTDEKSGPCPEVCDDENDILTR